MCVGTFFEKKRGATTPRVVLRAGASGRERTRERSIAEDNPTLVLGYVGDLSEREGT